jgi:tetratricopeptide (TPR) repeat protein
MPVYFLALFLLTQSDEIAPMLAQAETLFYQAKFSDSIEVLEKVDLIFQKQPGRLEEKTRTKLLLALSHVGVNRNDLAKADLRELFELKADYFLDPQIISPKVIALAGEIKGEQSSDECRTVRTDTIKKLESGNFADAVKPMEWIKANCKDLSSMESSAADLIYKEGVERVKHGQFAEALPRFETVLKLAPSHQLASQYLELIRVRLQLDADQLFFDWQRNFEAKQFESAKKAYVALKDLDEDSNLKLVHHIKTAYRNALSVLVQESKEACARGDAARFAVIQTEISKMLPDPSIGEGILSGNEQPGSNCQDPD